MNCLSLPRRSRLTARLVRVSAGDHSLSPALDHRLLVHQGPPVFAMSASDGIRKARRLQSDGDVDFIPAGCWGWWRDEGPSSLIALTLCPSVISSAASTMARSIRSVRLSPRLGFRDDRLAALARLTPKDDDPASWPFVDALATAVAIQLIIHAEAPSAPSTPTRLKPLGQRRLKAVLAHMDARLDQPLSLDGLAEAVGLKRSQFAAAFRLATGQSPTQYLIRRRVEVAAQLLQSGPVSISEVAFQTGFAHQSHLSRAMRRHVGLSPGALIRASDSASAGRSDETIKLVLRSA